MILKIYQKQILPATKFEFTIEDEPESTLTYEDKDVVVDRELVEFKSKTSFF